MPKPVNITLPPNENNFKWKMEIANEPKCRKSAFQIAKGNSKITKIVNHFAICPNAK